MADKAEHLSYGLVSLGLVPEMDVDDRKMRFLGILSKNRPESYITHVANMYQAITTVPLPTLSIPPPPPVLEEGQEEPPPVEATPAPLGDDAATHQLKFALNQTELTTVVVSEEYTKLLCQLKENDASGLMAKLEHLVIFKEDEAIKIMPEELQKAGEAAGLKLHFWQDIIDKGREILATDAVQEGAAEGAEAQAIKEPEPDDCFVLCYTPGTTAPAGAEPAEPKAIMYTHKMMMTNIAGIQKRLGEAKLTETDSYLSYLEMGDPLSQVMFSMTLIYSVQCGFYSGPIDHIQNELAFLKPTFFFSVPPVLTKIYQKVQEELKGTKGCKYWFVEKSVNSKLDTLETSGCTTSWMMDSLIFGKVKAKLGPNVRLMLCCGGPMAPEILKFLKIAFCVNICEAYGLAETGAISCLGTIGDI